MNFFFMILSARPNNRNPQSQGESGFEINALAMFCQIRNKQCAFSNIGDNLVIDPFIMFYLINSDWIESSLF